MRSNAKLLKFIIGLCMTAAGFLKLAGHMTVSSSFFSRIHIGSLSLGNSILMLPFIIGVIWLFASGGKSRPAGVLMGIGLLAAVLSVILNANIHLWMMPFSEWILVLVLLFGGIGLLLNALLGKDTVSSASDGGSDDFLSKKEEKFSFTEKKDLEKHRKDMEKLDRELEKLKKDL